jgi:hypothetical protein
MRLEAMLAMVVLLVVSFSFANAVALYGIFNNSSNYKSCTILISLFNNIITEITKLHELSSVSQNLRQKFHRRFR